MRHQVEVLDTELLDWQERKRQEYQRQNKRENPEIIFVGDSLIDFFPIKQLLNTQKSMVNRGIAGYISDLLIDYFPIHIFGDQLKEVYLLIGTNDLGMGIEEDEIIENITYFYRKLLAHSPNATLHLLSLLPVNEDETYAARVKIRRNQSIESLNRVLADLASHFEQMDYIDISQVLKDPSGQLKEDYTSDGLHLTPLGYKEIAAVLNEHLE